MVANADHGGVGERHIGFSEEPVPQPSSPQVGPARFRVPELLFQPDLVGDESEGLHEVLAFAIHKSDMDLRRTLFSNIVLSGGSTLFKGTVVGMVVRHLWSQRCAISVTCLAVLSELSFLIGDAFSLLHASMRAYTCHFDTQEAKAGRT